MIRITSPRIHNLGDFFGCLPALSGLYKLTGQKMSFTICDRLKRFIGIKELLLYQDMFCEVNFVHEQPNVENAMLIDDYDNEDNTDCNPIVTFRYANYIRKKYSLDLKIDENFELMVPKFDMDYFDDKFILGDRWSAKDAPDVDDRRKSNLLIDESKFPPNKCIFLDYSKDLVYNCSLVKHNKNPFISTITGISVISDLMKKDSYVLWDDDMTVWQGNDISYVLKRHYYNNRNTKFEYIKNFSVDKL